MEGSLPRLLSYVAIVALPIIGRAMTANVTVPGILVSHVPHAIAAFGELSPRLMPTPRSEHVFRHLVYALSMTSGAVCINWNALMSSEEEWATNFLIVFVVTNVALYYFTLAHIAENAGATWLHTHHGDITVLPMGLACIVALYLSLPPEADAVFVCMRSVPFFVVIHVAWSTMHLLGMAGFGLSQTGQLHHEHYATATLLGNLVASPVVFLIEVDAALPYYVLYTFVASLMSQFTNLEKGKHFSFGLLDVALPATWTLLFCVVGAISNGYDSVPALLAYAALTFSVLVAGVAVGKCVIGREHHLPMACLLVLLVTAVTEKNGTYDASGVSFVTVVAVRSALYGSFFLTHKLLATGK